MAASLAYYTAVSLFPLIALVILLTTSFVDQETVRTQLSGFITNYFPTSQEFLNDAIENLFRARLTTGAAALAVAMWSSSGLFQATIRTVNRVYESEPRRLVSITRVELALAGGLLGLFLVSVGASLLLRMSLDVTQQLSSSTAPVLRWLVSMAVRASMVILPPAATGVVFLVVYKTVPTRHVEWRDAAFGAVVATALFELAKLAFFWAASASAQRSVLYGPMSSALVLLLWSHTAAMIFLYGASIARSSGDLHAAPS